jgi:hypothetical protein
MKVFFARRTFLAAFLVCTALALVAGLSFTALHQAHAQTSATSLARQISSDPFTNDTSQHQTQVEPSTFSHGSTVVTLFQSGRFATLGGASGILWATSHDAGRTWKVGTLPYMTVYTGGTYARASNAVVFYDEAHHLWLASVLVAKTTFENSSGSSAIVVSRSLDGEHWSQPALVAASGPSDYYDKDWIVCDTYRHSPYYGRCYEQWDNANAANQIMMSYSNDGGLTWSQAASPASQSFYEIGGQPVVQPNGNVIVPTYGYDKSNWADGIYSYRSTDGGATWTDLVKIAPSTYSGTADPFYRGGSLPSARTDASGKVYLVWAGCYFEANCLADESGDTADDIVMTTTTDGLTWTPLQRIPLDPIGSDVEHLTAGLSIDSATAGQKAHLAVAYFYWGNAGHCDQTDCQAYVGLATSTNGGKTWSKHLTLAGPTIPDWWAITEAGYMTGDYITTAISFNRAVAVVPIATAPTGTTLHQAMYAASVPVTGGSLPCDTLSASSAAASSNAVSPKTVPGTKSKKDYRYGA